MTRQQPHERERRLSEAIDNEGQSTTGQSTREKPVRLMGKRRIVIRGFLIEHDD